MEAGENRGGDAYLNNRLETIWENVEYDNVFGHGNPYSQSKVILNWISVSGSLKHPAVFVTSTPRFSYDSLRSQYAESNLRGSLVVWMRNGDSEIDIYYVDVEGRKSRLRLTVEQWPQQVARREARPHHMSLSACSWEESSRCRASGFCSQYRPFKRHAVPLTSVARLQYHPLKGGCDEG